MIVDRLSRLGLYKELSPSLCSLEKKSPVPEFSSYEVDKDHFALFAVREGQYLASTTWRENPYSREPVAAVKLGPSSFALFLPGEPYLVRETVPGSLELYRR